MNLVAPHPWVQQRYKEGAASFVAKRVRHFAVSAVAARRAWWSARWSCGSRPREFFFGEGSLRGRHLLGRIGNAPEFCSSRLCLEDFKIAKRIVMFLGNSNLWGNLPIRLAICCTVDMDYWVLPCILEFWSINCIRECPIQLRKHCMMMYPIRMSTLWGTHFSLMTAVHYRKAQLPITVTLRVSLRVITAERTEYILLLITLLNVRQYHNR